MKPEESHRLAETFDYVALGHGHKPYVVQTPEGHPYAYNPGAPERVNFGEEKYEKGYYLVTAEGDSFHTEFKPTLPRPMLVLAIDLDGAENADQAIEKFREQLRRRLPELTDSRKPLVELKLVGRVGFHPFELGRERLRLEVEAIVEPLHLEVKNFLSVVTRGGEGEGVKKSLTEIEHDVLRELIGTGSDYQGREDELARLAVIMRDLVLKGEVEGDELLSLLDGEG
jgi:DNA repair exonuclease SbcCD nuclease subunit